MHFDPHHTIEIPKGKGKGEPWSYKRAEHWSGDGGETRSAERGAGGS